MSRISQSTIDGEGDFSWREPTEVDHGVKLSAEDAAKAKEEEDAKLASLAAEADKAAADKEAADKAAADAAAAKLP